jgi:hypothetical protein
MQRINATGWTECGDATKAFNFLQDSLGKTYVAITSSIRPTLDAKLLKWRTASKPYSRFGEVELYATS